MTAQATIQERANEYYSSRFDEEMQAAIAASTGDELDWLWLQEMPLSFQKLATYHVREQIEWEILLGTGGPADRVLVITDLAGRIESAVWEFQDWFENWTPATNQDPELVQRFAEIVGYYEEG